MSALNLAAKREPEIKESLPLLAEQFFTQILGPCEQDVRRVVRTFLSRLDEENQGADARRKNEENRVAVLLGRRSLAEIKRAYQQAGQPRRADGRLAAAA